MSQQWHAIVATLQSEVAKATRALILEIDYELRKAPSEGGTPVDTNHARASWIPSIGAPTNSQADGASDAAHETGVQALLGYRLEQGSVFLANNVAYINVLDLGHSKQAPPGFIEAAIERAVATIQARYDQLRIEVGTQGAGTFVDLAGGAAAANLAEAYSPFGGDQ